MIFALLYITKICNVICIANVSLENICLVQASLEEFLVQFVLNSLPFTIF